MTKLNPTGTICLQRIPRKPRPEDAHIRAIQHPTSNIQRQIKVEVVFSHPLWLGRHLKIN